MTDVETLPRGMDDLSGLSDEQLHEQVAALAPLVQQDSAAASGMLALLANEAKRRSLGGLRAQSSYLHARAEVNQGHLAAALELIGTARGLWLEQGDVLSALRTDLGRMHVLDDMGRHAEAIAVGEALVARLDREEVSATESGDAAWVRAAALENLGVGLGYMGEHARALEAYAGAEATYRKMRLTEEIPRPLANRGVELIELGRYREAIDVLGTAADGFAAIGDDLFVGKCYAYTARAQLLLGDYIAAAAAAQRADDYLAEQPATTEYARAQLVRAETLTSLNLLEEALHVLDAVLPRLADAALAHDLADATYARGVALARFGRSDGALDDFRAAAAMYVDMTAPAMAATALLAQSELESDAEAEGLADAALGVLETSGRSRHYAAALVRKAQLAAPEAAAQVLETAARILADLDAPSVEWRVHHEQARLAWRRGDLTTAAGELERALSLIDAMRRTVVDERERMFFMAGRDKVLEDLIALQLESGDVAAAYRTTEEARARTLAERQRGELAGSTVSVVPSELDVIYTGLLTAAPDAAQDLRSDARVLERSLDQSVPGRPLPALDEATDTPQGLAVVVTYQTIGDEVLAFVDDGDGPVVTRHLASVQEVRGLLGELEVQWRRFAVPGLAVRQHAHLLAVTNDILQRFYLRLIAGVSGIPTRGRLLIVPCEPLGNVPFAALHDGVGYLVERFIVSVAPSRMAAAHAEAQRRKVVRQTLAVGVADPGIPHVAAEVEEIARAIAGAHVLVDDAATVDAVFAGFADHDAIHLACHGVHRPDSPLFSALKLGDRWLTAAEVAGWDLDGQLVVLSACSSGRQLGAGTGDELVGLPRAFLAAGAGAVVVNLWQVDDASSRALMTRFHRALPSLDPAAALRRAQLDLMHDLSHPYHWAPSVIFGVPNSKEHQ